MVRGLLMVSVPEVPSQMVMGCAQVAVAGCLMVSTIASEAELLLPWQAPLAVFVVAVRV